MIVKKTLETVEYDKVLKIASEYLSLDLSKEVLFSTTPSCDFKEVNYLLNKTNEAYKLLFLYNVNQVQFFKDVREELNRADKGGILSAEDILNVKSLLTSSRLVKSGILSVNDESITIIKGIAENLYFDLKFEKEISEKIISIDEIADNASNKLYSIRKNIAKLNSAIRDRLNSFVHGSFGKYLQDGVITMRGDRYVLPVKSEYRKQIKGLIHDQSASGSTLFIEPEQIVELNNELKTALIDEKIEINAILRDLSERIKSISGYLSYNVENLADIDIAFAKAIFALKTKSTIPIINHNGFVNIKRGRHPLISVDKVVPVSVNFGRNYNYLLITGPNTGGKTVTLKLVGLLSVMACSGFYVPAEDESELSVFTDIFCDIGDEQSIEQNLSTFSSHMKNVINVVKNVNSNSLVLLDELGAGTDPEEGSGLALAVIERLISAGSVGIITTHYSKLKEYAFESNGIENASMEFDVNTLSPLYKLNIGTPGSSNAIVISKRLGLPFEIAERAKEFISDDKISFENVLKKAEEARLYYEKQNAEIIKLKEEAELELGKIKEDRAVIESEKEKILKSAKTETRRIVNERVYEAEELLESLKELVKKEAHSEEDLFVARTIKNKIENSKYVYSEDEALIDEYLPFEIDKVKIGDAVYVKSIDGKGLLNKISLNKKEAEISIGTAKMIRPIKDLMIIPEMKKPQKKTVSISKRSIERKGTAEINILGYTVLDGVEAVSRFIDEAILSNLAEVKIIHGVGTGKLKKGIWDYLKGDKRVEEFRSGRYGEGEGGVTVVKLK